MEKIGDTEAARSPSSVEPAWAARAPEFAGQRSAFPFHGRAPTPSAVFSGCSIFIFQILRGGVR